MSKWQKIRVVFGVDASDPLDSSKMEANGSELDRGEEIARKEQVS